LDAAAAAVFTAADDAFNFMSARLNVVQARIESGQHRVTDLAAKAERLQSNVAASEPGDQHADQTALEEWSLDHVINEVKEAGTWLDSIEAVARGVHAAADRLANSRDDNTENSISTAERVAELANDVTAVIQRLDALRGKLLQVREKRLAAREFAAMLIAEAADLDTRFDNFQQRTTDLDARLVAARERAQLASHRTHRWITLGSVVIAAALLWFGASQVCVLTRAWRMARPHTNPNS